MVVVTVVILHGFTGCGAAMAGLVEALAPQPCWAPDLVGHGPGPHPDDPAAYRLDAMAESLRHRFGEPVDLVGYSMGGRLALTWACRYPDSVRSLCLIGASAGLADPADRQQRIDADERLASLIEQDLDEFVDRWMANPLFATQQRLGLEFLAASRDQRRAHDPGALARSLRQAGTGMMTPLHDQLGRLSLPVGLIVGADDPKFRAIAADLASALPHGQVHTIAHAGHAAHLENPEAVAAAVTETMRRV